MRLPSPDKKVLIADILSACSFHNGIHITYKQFEPDNFMNSKCVDLTRAPKSTVMLCVYVFVCVYVYVSVCVCVYIKRRNSHVSKMYCQ